MKTAIIGGGIIGLGIGWQLARHGQQVTLFERNQIGREASHAAAGMLAPYAEVGFEELDIMKLGRQSLRLYPRFMDELSEDAGDVPEFHRCGTLMAGVDRDDTEHLKRLYEFREELGLTVELITGTAAREREQLLSPNVVSALWLPDDAQINNRELVQSLKQAFVNCGGYLIEQTPVSTVDIKGGAIRSVQAGGERYAFETVIVAAGCWSGAIGGIPEEVQPPVRPVKGQIITMTQTSECDIKGIIRSPRMYLVPKGDGTIRLGATSEEKGFETFPTAGGQKELLEDGWEVIPSIYDLPLEETIAGLRPASRDHRPIVGESDVDGLYYATGHYRHGVLMTPVTVYELVEELLESQSSKLLAPFRPQRFHEH